MFAVSTVFRRHNALASHHINHPTGYVGTDIAVLRKNQSIGGKRATAGRSPDSWHNIYSRHLGTNLLLGTILMVPGPCAFGMEACPTVFVTSKRTSASGTFFFHMVICWEIEIKWGFHGTSGNTGMEMSKQ